MTKLHLELDRANSHFRVTPESRIRHLLKLEACCRVRVLNGSDGDRYRLNRHFWSAHIATGDNNYYRAQLVDWLFEDCEVFDLDLTTPFRAFSYFDSLQDSLGDFRLVITNFRRETMSLITGVIASLWHRG